MLKRLYWWLFSFLIIIYFLIWFGFFVRAEQWDLLDMAFDWQDTSEHAQILQWEDMVWGSESTLINISKFLLKVAAVVGVSMFLFGWVLFVLSFGDQWKMKKARTNLIYSWVWLALALSSVVLINMVQSITVWTLNNL